MLSTVWNIQRVSQSYIEKGRGKKEIEVAKRRGVGVKRRETSLASNHFPKCSPYPRFTELGREEKGEGGHRGGLGERKDSQKGERAIKPVITLLSKNGY